MLSTPELARVLQAGFALHRLTVVIPAEAFGWLSAQFISLLDCFESLGTHTQEGCRSSLVKSRVMPF